MKSLIPRCKKNYTKLVATELMPKKGRWGDAEVLTLDQEKVVGGSRG